MKRTAQQNIIVGLPRFRMVSCDGLVPDLRLCGR